MLEEVPPVTDLPSKPLIVFLDDPEMTMVYPYIFCSPIFSTTSIASTAALRWTSNLGSINILR